MVEDLYFSYDGIISANMGLVNVHLASGMFDEFFLPSREINEITVRGKEKPYFQEVRHSPISFSLVFAFDKGFTESRLREVARWLMQDYYKPFYFLNNPNRVFYAMVDGDSNLLHNGLKQGYITLNFRCDSPYAYTQQYAKNNLVFGNQMFGKIIDENTFTVGQGTRENLIINNNSLELDPNSFTWSKFSGKRWSDII